MLPETLANSYQQYKQDTSAFTTWLSHAAKARGWKPKKVQRQPEQTAAQTPTTPKTPKLKGRERKLARDAAAKEARSQSAANNASKEPSKPSTPAKWTITTGDLQQQINIVAEWAEINPDQAARMPTRVRTVLERAIAVRKRFAAWFERTADIDDSWDSNETHQYFIGLLERAAETLRPSAASGKGNAKTGPSHLSERSNYEVDVMRNYFSALHLHGGYNDHPDDDEDYEDYDDSTSIPPKELSYPVRTGAGSSKPILRHAIYELAEEVQTELAFKVFCFFEDLHSVQGELRRIWKKYAAGELNIMFATIITTAAITFVGRVEKEILDSYPELADDGDSFKTLSGIIYLRNEVVDESVDSAEVDRYKITPFLEFMYLPTARTLSKLAALKECFKDLSYPMPLPPISYTYVRFPELLETPRMQKFVKEDEILTQLIQDHCLQKTERENGIHIVPLFDDVFTETVRSVWIDGKVSVQATFAARILLDTLDILGPNFSGQKLLADHANYTSDSLRLPKTPKGDPFADELGWPHPKLELVGEIQKQVLFHMRDPILPVRKKSLLDWRLKKCPEFFDPNFSIQESLTEKHADIEPALRQQYLQNAKRLNVNTIFANEDPFFAINANPLYCGTLILNVCAMTEEAGVGLANHHWSIFSAAHLYNAMRQMKLTDVYWPEMEEVIEAQMGPLFANDLPTTPNAMQSRMHYRFGLHRRAKLYNKELKKSAMQSTPVTKTLLDFFASKENFDRTFYELEEHVHKKEEALTTSSTSKQPQPRRRQHQQRTKPLSPPQFLAKLEKYLPRVLRPMGIDYVNLTLTCNDLLRTMRDAIETQLGEQYPRLMVSDSPMDYGYIAMVVGVLRENSEAADDTKPRRDSEFEGGPQLMLARDVFEKEWKENIPRGRKRVLY